MKSIEKALAWAQSIQMFAAVSPHHQLAVSELWPILETLGIETALEVGTGQPPGIVVQMLRNHGVEATGLDAKPGSDYTGDMHDLPFKDNTFDLVASRHSLEHVLIPHVCLFEMARVSKRWLIVVAPEDGEKTWNWPSHLHSYSKGGWEMMFNRVGLAVRWYELGDYTEAYAREWEIRRDKEYRWLLEVLKS